MDLRDKDHWEHEKEASTGADPTTGEELEQKVTSLFDLFLS